MTQTEGIVDPQFLSLNCQASGIKLNPFANFAADPQRLLALLERASGCFLNPLQRVMATEVGVTLSAHCEPSASSLAAAWGEHHDLVEFANAVRTALLPR